MKPSEANGVTDTTDIYLTGKACRTALNCGICHEFMVGPIYQCLEGHMIWCARCSKAMQMSVGGSFCPVCRMSTVEPVRNRMLEGIATRLPRPCFFSLDGCQLEGNEKAMKDHALVCPFEMYRCDNDGCEYMDCDKGKRDSHKICCAYQVTHCPLIHVLTGWAWLSPGSTCHWHGPALLVHEHMKEKHGAKLMKESRRIDENSCFFHCHLRDGKPFISMRRIFSAHETTFLVTWTWAEIYPEGHKELTVAVQIHDPSLSGKFLSHISVSLAAESVVTHSVVVTNTRFSDLKSSGFVMTMCDSAVWGCLRFQHPEDDRFKHDTLEAAGGLPQEVGGCYIRMKLLVDIK